MLSAPVYISDITIDHVAKEVAHDLRPAPRQMELWGLVEGKDNLEKYRLYQQRKEQLREEALEQGLSVPEEAPYPNLPKSPPYMKIASFSYDIKAANNIQTFTVDEDIQDLGIDFGLVVLMINSNWGLEDFTCLYRLRVHGAPVEPRPLPEL